MDYFDDLAEEQGGASQPRAEDDAQPRCEPVAIAHKNVHLVGVSLYCEEFAAADRHHSRSPQPASLSSLVRLSAEARTVVKF